MDPINILVGITLLVSIAANLSAAKSAVKQTVIKFELKPKTWLQKIPPNIAALILILQILAIFGVGTLDVSEMRGYLTERIIGLCIFILFAYLQTKSYKYLGNNYTQDIGILKNHQLVSKGFYKYVRHPQYISQVLSDLGAGIALLGYIVVPMVILVELPLMILRAKREESLLANHFKNEYDQYKKKTGFILPFIG
ncbi:MAG: hypothetical protein CVV23_16195 [Ignavibacteriae bacterium HGW-Ignavibacteriae-2]|jgi:protein-S-isoprenylcysteine O-methyltransferase Ste14|nr:isoprenylcysteine carboxylmethyltransferase family protein [Bacteroidota bacterium]PKL87275.1 MAG: hypothetical protein CVV23_16195 [Ignavibacteriae bacterium HGW-Ignavibacteriae-2]